MIIFGSRTINSTAGAGVFHCPRCSMQRPYKHKNAKRFFTLYFIPLIPIGSAGEFIECGACAGTYGVEVLSYDPVAERSAIMADVRRSLVLVMLATRRTEAAHVSELRSICADLLGDPVSEEQIWEDLRLAKEVNAQLIPYVRQQLGELNDRGKEVFLEAAGRLIASGGGIREEDKDVVRQLTTALGVSAATIRGLLPGPPGPPPLPTG